ncbi:unnamed protein product [Peronospora destructor]|uniref:DUF7802 domain-containing protein n=1 Tax=Peronospora destructor TaxID=86335 RepID=A0AAV0V8W3_9STRA|nr:unnamed protein product [Peronospora destructor]
MVTTSFVMPIAFLRPLNENVSLATVEGVTYLSVFLLMLHVHSSGKAQRHHAQLYYIASVVTLRLRIDPFFQPFAMGSLMLLLVFPFELLGTKFLWWMWHDTDPFLADRLMGVPCHSLFTITSLLLHSVVCTPFCAALGLRATTTRRNTGSPSGVCF